MPYIDKQAQVHHGSFFFSCYFSGVSVLILIFLSVRETKFEYRKFVLFFFSVVFMKRTYIVYVYTKRKLRAFTTLQVGRSGADTANSKTFITARFFFRLFSINIFRTSAAVTFVVLKHIIRMSVRAATEFDRVIENGRRQ